MHAMNSLLLILIFSVLLVISPKLANFVIMANVFLGVCMSSSWADALLRKEGGTQVLAGLALSSKTADPY